MARADPEVAVHQLHQPRVADVVAGILRARIVEGRLADGSRLPKQDELLREFRVSRPSLREALRILEAEGLITVQRGSVGGAIVRAPSTQSSAYMLGLVLQSGKVVLEDLAEAIQNVEPVVAAMCARRPDRHETVVPRLRTAHALMAAAVPDGVDFVRRARRFHEECVLGCGNTTMIAVIHTLELMWFHQEQVVARPGQDDEVVPTLPERETLLDVHASVLDAIERGDPDQAASLEAGHMRAAQRFALDERRTTVVQAGPVVGGRLGA